MGRFINPFTDVGFKKIFGQEISKDLLIDFLNGLLAGERHIADIQFLDKELLPQYLNDRGVIYDVYCTSDTGERFIVEMQNSKQLYFRERAIYYMSRTIAEQGERGVDWQFKLDAVYGVFFMNFTLTGLDELRSDIALCNQKTNEQFSDKVRMIFIQLPLFEKEEDECDNNFERWIYVLKNMETLKRMPFKHVSSVFRKLEDIVDIASLSKEDRIKYDESIKVYRDNLVTMGAAIQEGWDKGLKAGMQQGLQQGMQQGLQQGLQQGKEEGLRDGIMLIAKNMKNDGISSEQIAKITGLSIEEINKI